MATPDAAPAVIETVGKTTQLTSVISHIVERRLEYLLATLIANQLGLLDQVITYGTGLC